jgi:hypothetical protein
MKAYKVSCSDEDHGCCIEFAERGKDVSKLSHSEHCDCPLLEREVRREPRFDKYAPGPLTIANHLTEGWYWQCANCEALLHAEDRPLIDEDGRNAVCDARCADSGLARYADLGDKCHESIKAFRASMVRILESQKQPA